MIKGSAVKTGLCARQAKHYATTTDLRTKRVAFVANNNCRKQKGDGSGAADVIDSLLKVDENKVEAMKTLARLRLAQGDKTRALEAIRASFYVSPFDYYLHTKAGELSLESKDYARALAEFQVTLALQPPNLAEANYNVATAYYSLGKQPEAKKAVLRALEAAPRYEKAQELLLRIVGQ